MFRMPLAIDVVEVTRPDASAHVMSRVQRRRWRPGWPHCSSSARLGDHTVALPRHTVTGRARRCSIPAARPRSMSWVVTGTGKLVGPLAVDHALDRDASSSRSSPRATVPCDRCGRMARPSANSGLGCCALNFGWASMSLDDAPPAARLDRSVRRASGDECERDERDDGHREEPRENPTWTISLKSSEHRLDHRRSSTSLDVRSAPSDSHGRSGCRRHRELRVTSPRWR